jgi:hypothetical protein
VWIVRRLLLAVALTPLLGCGSAVFYETAPAGPSCAESTPPVSPKVPIAEEERATEVVRDDGWRDSIRQLIQQPPARVAGSDPACIEDLRELKVEVSAAIELAVAHRDWRRERCLSITGQTLGTLYHASMGVPFVDQRGRIFELDAECSAAEMARVAQACAS